MIIFLIIGFVLAMLFYVINIAVYYLNKDSTYDSDLMITYECGFDTIENQARTQHSINYYLIALLYVIFDLEIALILPALISLTYLNGVLLIIVMTLLCLCFVYELNLNTFKNVNKLQY